MKRLNLPVILNSGLAKLLGFSQEIFQPGKEYTADKPHRLAVYRGICVHLAEVSSSDNLQNGQTTTLLRSVPVGNEKCGSGRTETFHVLQYKRLSSGLFHLETLRVRSYHSVPPCVFDPRPSKQEYDRAFAAPDADGVIRTGHYNVIQVFDGTAVTIYRWTQPKKGLVWCLASANCFDVSHLKWGGDETYAEVLFELLAKSPTFLASTGLRLRRGLLCVDDVGLDFQTLDRGRCYTIGFRHPNFHPMAADPPGVWNIQSVDLASGVATAAGLPGIHRQAAYNHEDFVRLVGSQDVRHCRIRVEDLELISRRALDDEKAAIAGKPVLGQPRVGLQHFI